MKTIINENQRGLLFKNGKFTEYLKPGKHIRYGNNLSVQPVHIDEEFKLQGYDLEVFMANKDLESEVVTVDVADETLALHFVNGKYTRALTSGKYAFFKIHDKHEFKVVTLEFKLLINMYRQHTQVVTISDMFTGF